LPHQDGAGLDAPRQHNPPVALGELRHQCFEKARGRAIKPAIGIFLDLVGNAPAQEIGSKGLGRIGFELRAPERAKLNNWHRSKPFELGFDHRIHVLGH
jgi:hypothetical protein